MDTHENFKHVFFVSCVTMDTSKSMDTYEYFKKVFDVGDLCFGWRVGSYTGLIISTRRGCCPFYQQMLGYLYNIPLASIPE